LRWLCLWQWLIRQGNGSGRWRGRLGSRSWVVAEVAIATATAGVAAMVNAMAVMATATVSRWWRLRECQWWGEGERNCNDTGGSNSGSRRGARSAGRAAAVQCFFILILFYPIYFLTVTAVNTECQGNGVRSLATRHTQGLLSSSLSLMCRCPRQWALSSLSPLLFTLLLLFQLPSPSPLPTFFLLALLVDCCLCPPPSLSPLLFLSPLTAVALANHQGLQLDRSK
jgi:hypothetical protein